MAIEVTSVPDRHAKLTRRLRAIFRLGAFARHRFFHRLAVASLILITAIGVHTLFQSYRYYSQIIDARLARGYLTSRPGLYAAPTTLRTGQGLSPDELVTKLRRAGYVEQSGSDVWSGSFKRDNRNVEIRSTLSHGSMNTAPLCVAFGEKDGIKELTQDGFSLDSFTLEPEVLTNDVLIKSGERQI